MAFSICSVSPITAAGNWPMKPGMPVPWPPLSMIDTLSMSTAPTTETILSMRSGSMRRTKTRWASGPAAWYCSTSRRKTSIWALPSSMILAASALAASSLASRSARAGATT